MLYRTMPKTGDELSILGFGCMRFPGGQMNPHETEAIKQIRYAIDKGVNYLDTAWPYHGGKSEVILGKALKNGYREKVKVADKLPVWLCKNRDDMDYYLNTQLERLDDTFIDYYLIHALDLNKWERAKERGIFSFMEEAKRSGKIKHIGFSFHGLRDDFKKIIDDYEWDFCQIQFNILDEKNQAGLEGLEYAYKKNIGVVIMEPLRGGALAGKLPAAVEHVYSTAPVKRGNVEWALRWIWNHPGVITVLSGMNTIAQIDENCSIASEADIDSLSASEQKIVNKAADTFRSLMKVPCTGCQYCMPCPANVNIPLAFSFYNNKYLFNEGLMNRVYYLMQLDNVQAGKASLPSQCIDCGKCLAHCPQNIAIPSELKKVTKEFEGFGTGIIKFLVSLALRQGKRN